MYTVQVKGASLLSQEAAMKKAKEKQQIVVFQ